MLAWLFAAHVLGPVQQRGGTHWVGRVASQWLDFRPFLVPLGRPPSRTRLGGFTEIEAVRGVGESLV